MNPRPTDSPIFQNGRRALYSFGHHDPSAIRLNLYQLSTMILVSLAAASGHYCLLTSADNQIYNKNKDSTQSVERSFACVKSEGCFRLGQTKDLSN